MSTVQEYRNPLLIAAGAIVVAILIYTLGVSPQTSKLSTLQTQQTTLQTQEQSLQAQLTALQTEKQKLPANCADLQKIATQIPSVQSASDLAAEQSSFYNQLTALIAQSGTSFTTFAFTGGTTAAPSSSGTTAAGVVPVPVSLSVTGNFSQMSTFVAGLDSYQAFPRLFVIQTFALSLGSGGAASPTTPASGGSSTGSGSATPSLWTGGTATSPTAGPYSLALTGSIYYTSTPDALAACTKAITPAK
jgi:Tfp pilus assembly protein PilO